MLHHVIYIRNTHTCNIYIYRDKHQYIYVYIYIFIYCIYIIMYAYIYISISIQPRYDRLYPIVPPILVFSAPPPTRTSRRLRRKLRQWQPVRYVHPIGWGISQSYVIMIGDIWIYSTIYYNGDIQYYIYNTMGIYSTIYYIYIYTIIILYCI